jgi:hypothetical protein
VSEPRDLRDLLGDEVGPEELAELGRIDELLRSVPPPPATVPGSLTQAVARVAEPRRPSWVPRRLLLAATLALALAALAFGVGVWSAGEEEGYRAVVRMQATQEARGAEALIRLGERESSGNWGLRVEVSGLPELPAGDYYVLWLAKDGEYAATCGTFNVGEGVTAVEMSASYRLADYDAWVISGHEDDAPWLLSAAVS